MQFKMDGKKISSVILVMLYLIPYNVAEHSELPACLPEENYFLPNNSCVDKTTPRSRPLCKNVTVLKGDIETTICLPFSTEFMLCQRWLFDATEYEIQEPSQSLYVPSEERNYALNEYDLRNGEDGIDAIICVNENSDATKSRINVVYIYSTAWIISIISLVAALILCIAVPGFTTYRAVMPCYVGSLLASYIILVVRGLGPSPSPLQCFYYGVSLQFSFLSAFFWINVIAFDLWQSIISPILNPGKIRLFFYMLYGWGFPLLFVAAAIGVDLSKNTQILSVFRPHFERDCWFHGTVARFAYFYGPISVILLINLIFFILTVSAVRKKVATQEVEKHFSLLRLSIELVVIMGLCWIMEVVSWAVGGDARYWYATDIINALQGLFVFIIIVRRPNITSWIKQSFKKKKSYAVEEESNVSYIQPDNKYYISQYTPYKM